MHNPRQMAPTLTFVVPAYNMETYLPRCVDSLLAAGRTDDIEVIIVDDGSSDGTPSLADAYARRRPESVRVIHQPNKGHGGAVNAGIAEARGLYVKVVDADDWVGRDALEVVMRTLRAQAEADAPVDMVVTNYVYDKVGKARKHVVHFRSAMEPGRVMGWDDLGRFGVAEYILMHALIFRTDVVRESGMELPEHTFYVDFLYAYQPFPWVRTILYLDVPLYHYFIGREGQSVQTDAMVRRVSQLIQVNRLMVEATPERGTVPDGLYRYMIHFLSIESSITTVFLILSRDPRNYARQRKLWADMRAAKPAVAADTRARLVARVTNLATPLGRAIVRVGYRVANHFIGFN